jgi:hypothetical protein
MLLLVLAILSVRCSRENTISNATGGEARLTGTSHSDCLDDGINPLDHATDDSARVDVFVSGLEVTVVHYNCMLNCCLDSIGVEFAHEDNVLILTEVEYYTTPCFCHCPYEVTAKIEVPAPGLYVIEVWTYDILVWRGEIEVPGG